MEATRAEPRFLGVNAKAEVGLVVLQWRIGVVLAGFVRGSICRLEASHTIGTVGWLRGFGGPGADVQWGRQR
jgi:hypothetical protein